MTVKSVDEPIEVGSLCVELSPGTCQTWDDLLLYSAAPVNEGTEIDPASLKDVSLFAGLSRRVRRIVAQHADEVELATGTEIVSEGALAYELFVIVEGTAEVSEGGTKIAEMGPGDIIGEIGVLKTHRRMATVTATTPVKAVVVYGPELTALRGTMPEVFTELESLIEERLSQ